jgi:hypothetical protein
MTVLGYGLFQDRQPFSAVSSSGSPGCPRRGTCAIFNLGFGTYNQIYTQNSLQGTLEYILILAVSFFLLQSRFELLVFSFMS